MSKQGISQKSQIARQTLQEARSRIGSWDGVAQEFGLKNRSTAWNIAHGKQRPSEELFARISGLSEIRRVAVPFLREREEANSGERK
jgi:hypothetical protein